MYLTKRRVDLVICNFHFYLEVKNSIHGSKISFFRLRKKLRPLIILKKKKMCLIYLKLHHVTLFIKT